MSYDFFEPTQEVDKYINKKDLHALRGIIVGIINRDPTFATKRYAEALNYISGSLDIWDDVPEKLPGEYKLERDKWDKEYFRKQLAWLSQNFTHERAETIEEIGKYVYANENTWGKQEAENFHHPVTQKKSSKKMPERDRGVLMALLIVMIVAVEVVLLITDLILIVKIIAVVIGVIAIVCIVVASMKKKKNKEKKFAK